MASFLKVGSHLLSSLAQSIQEHITDPTTTTTPSTSTTNTNLFLSQDILNNDLNYIQHGNPGVLVFHLGSSETLLSNISPTGSGSSTPSRLQARFDGTINQSNSIEYQKILHLNYEKNYIIIYKIPILSSPSSPTVAVAVAAPPNPSSTPNSSNEKYPFQVYLIHKISFIRRLNSKSIQIDFHGVRQPLIINFQNEPDSNQFMKFLLYSYFYYQTLLEAYQEILLNDDKIITFNNLLTAYNCHHITISSDNLQELLNLPSSKQLDFINFFELLLDIPVYNTFDCLIGLLSRIGLNDLSFTPYQEPLIQGEMIVKHVPHTRWFLCHTELDINNTHHQIDRTAWFGSLIFTNYRLILYCKQKTSYLHSREPLPVFFNKLSIPLNSISRVILSSEPHSLTHHIRLNLITKDNKLFRIIFVKDMSYTQAVVFHRQLLNGIFLTSPQRMFCFFYKQIFEINGWKFSNIRYDYERLGLTSDPKWTVVDNPQGELIETYPSLLVIPSSIPWDKIQRCILFRSLGRFPVVTYVHKATQCCLTRSAQPVTSQSSTCVQSDRELLDAYRTSGIINQLRESNPNNSSPILYIIDARGWLAIAANVAGGKGTEDIGSYPNCQLVLCDIDNIHGMRNSYNSFSTAIFSQAGLTFPTSSVTSMSSSTSTLVIPEDSLLKKIDQSGWLTHCSRLLSTSVFVAEKLHHEKSSVLVHCSDGWDRTAQITSLTQLILDPYYRTLEGFAVLIEKEWCSFGHKFHIRCGHSDTFDSPLADQRSPIFIQFLHIVQSILNQFPCSFEYSEYLLIFIADHLYSGLFGNFLGNSEKERKYTLLVEEKTQSIWSYILTNKRKFQNNKYEMVNHPLWPYCGVSKITLWERYMMRWNPYAHPKSDNPIDYWEDDLGDGYIMIPPSFDQNNSQEASQEYEPDGFL